MTTFGEIMDMATAKIEDVKVVDQAKIDRMIEALAAGKAWAKSLRVGQPFVGCAVAAEAAGYDRNSPEGRLFISEAFDGLRGLTVYTDRETGLITRIADRFGAEDAIAEQQAGC